MFILQKIKEFKTDFIRLQLKLLVVPTECDFDHYGIYRRCGNICTHT